MFQKRFIKPILLLGLTLTLTGCALETKEEAAIRLRTITEQVNFRSMNYQTIQNHLHTKSINTIFHLQMTLKGQNHV